MDRRKLVKTAIAGSAAAMAGNQLAHAQTPESSPSVVASPAVQATPVGQVQEDGYYPSGTPGVPDAWTKVPEPYAAYDGTPGNGGTVSAMVMIYGAPPTPKDESLYWQELDKRLGVSWEPILVPNASYGEKATALIASGDIPDLFYLNYNQTLSPLASFVQDGAFLDLTPYVTGENLQKYPNLATFSDFMWEAAKMDGKIYGVPCPNSPVGSVPNVRTDWAKTITGGVPTDAEGIYNLFTGMSTADPDGNGRDDTWGFGKYGTSWDVSLIYPMFRVPNSWRVNDDGTFVHMIESDEYRLATEFMRRLWEGGAYHPDAPSMGFEEALQLFDSGRTGLIADGGGIWGSGGHLETIRQYQPEATLDYLIPPGHDGGQGVTNNLPGVFGFTALSVALEGDDARIDELLRIFDWMSCPFGSEEWLFKNHGIEGTHFEFDERGTPMTNDLWAQENGGLTGYIGGNLLVNFVNTEPDKGPLMTDAANRIYAQGIDNPAANLFSPAAIEKGPVLSQLIADAMTSIVTGRENMSALDRLIEEWRSRGGDEIRSEFEEAYAANQG